MTPSSPACGKAQRVRLATWQPLDADFAVSSESASGFIVCCSFSDFCWISFCVYPCCFPASLSCCLSLLLASQVPAGSGLKRAPQKLMSIKNFRVWLNLERTLRRNNQVKMRSSCIGAALTQRRTSFQEEVWTQTHRDKHGTVW